MLKIKAVRPEVVTVLASLYLLLGFNSKLWAHVFQVTAPDHTGFVLGIVFAALIWILFNILLTLVAFRGVLKPVLITLFMLSSGIAYFMNEYGVIFDAAMFRNVAETNPTEALALLSGKLFLYIVLLGVLPSWLLYKTPIRYRRWPAELLSKALVSVGCAALLGAMAMINYQGLASLFRNHHELRLMVVPSNLVGAAYGYLREQVATAGTTLRPTATDAQRDPASLQRPHKSLTVLVVGESARAENFGLLGYARDTTPKLRAEGDVIAFGDVWSCGTETAVSVPCMFSNLGRKRYDAATARTQEGLLDVLKRAGYDVVWLDNQAGCKGTCDRVTFQDLSNDKDPALCANHECRDMILLRDLQSRLDNLQHDTVLVLHQMGSHGPEYYKRYPAEFEKFTPVCQSNALNNCSRENIINGYDNTLLYTDHVLATLIDTLRRNQDKVDTAMLYLSDHGESLGEYNLFLHGTPYMVAPEQQRHIPMVAWFSPSYRQSFGVDTDCLQNNRNLPLSQDNLFHSMLGLLDVKTSEYQKSLDMFAACRKPSA
ncbi:phosphoethanolamine--lipid A transferase [Pseudomonas sp. DTU_2021_1001937_2_SI_NGA_ILE_001]|uniref:phosphoethanolamine transferase n=1 Tax=Pseudomonas sp. DTU_2021_1001937_2_SI_NGA_ILE_001 TaxID=3077589 RepID=UPI0028FC1EDE|nr:phosphoethanolamine--lipid A transferase [Pseudomonas sp. DTU_2021_1001937_2_SI_NGA_ILE_001]WNW09986.1 phosphoethanolamine--lipid A transferase [Pseudomonas sp. DTU_2021_1001937_2_SI_NGA_ILE_001]